MYVALFPHAAREGYILDDLRRGTALILAEKNGERMGEILLAMPEKLLGPVDQKCRDIVSTH
jgi:hypothetical protein